MSYYVSGASKVTNSTDNEIWKVGSTIDKRVSWLDNYEITYKDDSTSDKYWLFINPQSNYYIMNESTSGSVQTYKYYVPKEGDSTDFITAWSNRLLLTYEFYEKVF